MNNPELADFVGSWRVSRQISAAGTQDAQAEGRASWTRHDDGLLYTEDLMLHLPDTPPMKATRRYMWRTGLDVYFEDGRFFHKVPVNGGWAHHACSPDTYRVTYDFAQWPMFETTWQVSGPRKDYTMMTKYTRS